MVLNMLESFEWNKDSNKTHNMLTLEQIRRKSIFENWIFKALSQRLVQLILWLAALLVLNSPMQIKVVAVTFKMDLLICINSSLLLNILKPKYWAMENVPRVKNILEKVLDEDAEIQTIQETYSIILEVVDSSEFGVPQKRKRMLAGQLSLINYSKRIKTIQTVDRTLGDVTLIALQKDDQYPILFTDYAFPKNEVTDHIIEEPLNPEELRLNRESKEFHAVYNGMSFPEKLDRALENYHFNLHESFSGKFGH